MSVYIIAEAGVNHNGNLQLAFQLCDAAKDAGVDAVKFQTWQTEKIVTQSAAKATYQAENTHNLEESQFDMLKKLELTYTDFKLLQKHCEEIGIDFLSTPDEEYSLAFLMNELHLPIIKISSGEVTNIPYLRKIASYHKPVILSTGMATLAQAAVAYDTLKEAGAPEVSVLHCTTNYPCPMEEVNLRAMQTMKDAFKCKVGYSDHTLGIEIPIAAVAMGAEIIEKHFTLDKEMNGPDHKASLNPQELKDMVAGIRNIELALGDGIKKPNNSEIKISTVVLKRIVASKSINAGDILNENNMTLKRCSNGISANYWDLINGRIAERDYHIDEAIIL